MSRTRVALDFCLSHRLTAVLDSLYGHHGFEFLHLRNLVHKKSADPSWADRYKSFGGRIVLSGDCRIAYKPHEAVAFIDNGFTSFFPDEKWSRLKGHAKASLLVFWWPRLVDAFNDVPPGTCWRIPCNLVAGELRLKHCPLKPLEIPDHVLEEARARRSA